MPCNAPEDKDMLDKPPCKIYCVLEKNESTSNHHLLNAASNSARIKQQITALLFNNTYAELKLKPTARPFLQNKFVAFLESA